MLVLLGNQPFRGIGAVAEQVRTGKGDEVVEHRRFPPPHPINGDIGELGQPHRLRIDALFLRAPFLRDGVCKRLRRHGQLRLGWRADQLVVEQNGNALVFGRRGDLFVKALRLCPF